jgi:hypothetical protein
MLTTTDQVSIGEIGQNSSSIPAFDALRAVSVVLIVLSGAAASYFWLTNGWLHVELLPVSSYVRSRGWLSVFDWKLFDSSPDRMRPLSDFVEVFDAMLRPYTVRLFGHHPSATLSSIGMALASAGIFYKALRYFGHSRNAALILTALLISTIGFQSCFVAYIRPAKRLALLGVCAMLFLTGQYANTKSRTDFSLLCGTILLIFLADETGFVLWLVAALLLIPHLRGPRIAIFASLPLVYFALIKIAMPPLYGSLGISGPRDGAVGVSIIERLLSNLLSPDFYAMAATDLARSLSVTIGVIAPYERVALGFVAALLCLAIAKRQWLVISSSLAVIGTSLFLSMIDMANGPGNFFAQLTFYYHSALAPLVVFWIASIFAWIRPISFQRSVLAAVATAVISFNFVNFDRINELTKILHTYPMTTLDPTGFDEAFLQKRFEYLLSSGPLPEAGGYRAQFAYYRDHPMGNESYAGNLLRAFEMR